MADRALLALVGAVATGAGLDTVWRGARSIPGTAAVADAGIESELRFYSAFYVAYGAVLLRAAARDTASLRALAAPLLAGGAARAVAWARVGKPTVAQRLLLVVELAGPLAVMTRGTGASDGRG